MAFFKGGFVMKALYWICLILVIIGALNWGLIGIFHFNLVAALFGVMSGLSRLIYTLVGVAAVILILMGFKSKKQEA